MTSERRQQIEALYREALERAPGSRSVFLDGACRSDADLRLEVESLLAQAAEDEGVPDPAGEIKNGTEIGAYRIEARAGEGGMGVVYRALDTKLNRPVAIKFLSGDLGNVAARRRFQREAQMASSLNHPHRAVVVGLRCGA